MIRLINVSYTNEYSVDLSKITIELTVEDSLNNFKRIKDEFFINYERKFHSTDSKLLINVVFQFRSKINDNVTITNTELIDLVQSHKRQYVLSAPSEASLIISNILKSAGFPSVITKPTFIEETEDKQ